MKTNYTGILAQPYAHVPRLGLLATAKQLAAQAKREKSEYQMRMNALFDFYNIPPGEWRLLAESLAAKHVPGFQEERASRGAPPKWDHITRAELRIEVDDYRRERLPKRISITQAIAVVARRQSWRQKIANLTNAGAALRKQYDLASEVWVKTSRRARAWEMHQAHPELSFEEIDRRSGLGE